MNPLIEFLVKNPKYRLEMVSDGNRIRISLYDDARFLTTRRMISNIDAEQTVSSLCLVTEMVDKMKNELDHTATMS